METKAPLSLCGMGLGIEAETENHKSRHCQKCWAHRPAYLTHKICQPAEGEPSFLKCSNWGGKKCFIFLKRDTEKFHADERKKLSSIFRFSHSKDLLSGFYDNGNAFPALLSLFMLCMMFGNVHERD